MQNAIRKHLSNARKLNSCGLKENLDIKFSPSKIKTRNQYLRKVLGDSTPIIMGELVRLCFDWLPWVKIDSKLKSTFEYPINRLCGKDVRYKFIYSKLGRICHYFKNAKTECILRIT